MSARWPADFSRLVEELEKQRLKHPERQANYTRVRPDADKLARIPLVHGCDRRESLDEFARDCAPLSSRTARGVGPNDAEHCLGISDRVYASMGILYPDKAVALLFGECVEVTDTDASPWDSGAFHRELESDQWSRADRRQLFEDHALEAPWHRSYLVEYVASCFWNAMDYLDVSCRHAFPDPLGMLETMRPRLRSFEVRVPTRIPIRTDTLAAVFLRQGKTPLSPVLSTWLAQLDAGGVAIKIDRTRRSRGYLQKAVQEWIHEQVSRA